MPFVRSGSVALFFEEAGRGTPIIFAHELAADARQWAPQTAELSHRFRCIAYNARGYPPSGVPGPDDAYAHTAFVEDIGALMDELALDQAFLVGCSMGAYAALLFALEHPERVRGVVAAGAGSGSPAGEIDAFRADMLSLANLYLTQGALAGAQRILAGANRQALRRRSPALWKAFAADLAGRSATGMARVCRNFQGLRPSLLDFADGFSRMAVPVLLAVGEEDEPCIETNQALERLIPGARLWTAPGSGHSLNLEDPQAFNQAMEDFIDAVERGTWPR